MLLYWQSHWQKFISEGVLSFLRYSTAGQWLFVSQRGAGKGIVAMSHWRMCWRDIWDTTDTTWYHPTSQLVSDFFFWRLWKRIKKKYRGGCGEERVFALQQKWVGCLLLYWAYSLSPVFIVTVVCVVRAKCKETGQSLQLICNAFSSCWLTVSTFK